MKNKDTFFYETRSSEETKQLGACLAPLLRTNDLIILSGDLGAGKTQFVQGVGQGLGIQDSISSPSFTLMLSYEAPEGITLNHFDLYRLDTFDQLEDIAFFETIESGGVSFVEWGEKFPEALPEDYLLVSIKTRKDESRTISFCAYGKELQRRFLIWAEECGAQREEKKQ